MNFFLKKKTVEEIKEKKFLLSFKEFIRIYWNKSDSYFLEEFISGEIQKRNKHLKFRKNGDVDYDFNSREPLFVAYNNTRLEMKEWMRRGVEDKEFKCYALTGNFSVNVITQLENDGFSVFNIKENVMGHRNIIYMVSTEPWSL